MCTWQRSSAAEQGAAAGVRGAMATPTLEDSLPNLCAPRTAIHARTSPRAALRRRRPASHPTPSSPAIPQTPAHLTHAHTYTHPTTRSRHVQAWQEDMVSLCRRHRPRLAVLATFAFLSGGYLLPAIPATQCPGLRVAVVHTIPARRTRAFAPPTGGVGQTAPFQFLNWWGLMGPAPLPPVPSIGIYNVCIL